MEWEVGRQQMQVCTVHLSEAYAHCTRAGKPLPPMLRDHPGLRDLVSFFTGTEKPCFHPKKVYEAIWEHCGYTELVAPRLLCKRMFSGRRVRNHEG